MILNVLLLAGPVLGLVPYRDLITQAVKAPPSVFALGVEDGANTSPCATISKAFEAARRNATSEKPIILDLRPSVGTACLKSLPVATERDLALLDYLRPYVEYQSTIELLKSPPPEYLLPGVDIIGGMKAMRQQLKDNKYQSQLDVMTDLQSLFVAANDNHFGYTPGLLTAFRQIREGFDFVSISKDGLELPEVFAAEDIVEPGNRTYVPSPIDTIDGQEVYAFLENDALRTPQGAQDPDARLNNQFRSVPGAAAGAPGGAQITIFSIPDNYTIAHKNGTVRTVINSIVTLPTIDLCGIRSGQDFRDRFEIPPRNRPTPPKPPKNETTDRPPQPQAALPGYPPPLVQHSSNNVASYALNDTELRDTTVISFLSFVALGVADPLGADFDLNSFVREFGDVIDRTASAAKAQRRDKLIIDMSANGGGSLDLADFAYTTFFPGAPFEDFDRYRLNGGLEFTGRFVDYNTSLGILVGPEGLPFGPDNRTIETADAFFESPPVKNQKMTAAFHRDTSARYFIQPDVFLRGYEPTQGKNEAKREAPWKPENIVILTDGQLLSNADNKGLITDLVRDAQRSRDGQALLQDLGGSIPSIQDPPLLPFIEDPANGGSVNSRNAYSGSDTNGFPLHFKYEAANCRLFYTQKMSIDVTESWRRAAQIAFGNGTCVSGSSTGAGGRIGSKTLQFDPSVRSTRDGIPRPVLRGMA
ncbi:hypothetical protein NLG97_g760 [Lecanicillium saksenae]|uniref:Uncharacterized protein n=1 Tax=Lecanicillium saksenae TaxID=468837 RepID=A0ACC1R5W7_9HYPO|nr:hypothetical protein NLG97_g760 [Lecanicillium saksenae]